MSKRVFKSRIDWWVWCMVTFAVVVVCVVCIGSYWYLALIYGAGLMLLCVLLIFGCWYEIVDDNLVVYQFFKPHLYPVGKIKAVRKSEGYIATAGMSRHRVSVYFQNRSVMRSSRPLEVSPRNRDAFIERLVLVNPEIQILD